MSTYSTNLALELIGTGEQAGVWGTTTNTNLGTLIEQAISGYVTQAVATGTDTTITIPNGTSGVARNMYIELTGTGGASTNLIVPANKKLYFIFNNSTGAVTVKVSGQTGVSVPTGKKMVLVSNGTDIVNGLNYIADFASNSATITHLSATSATITNLTLTSLVISNLSIASANITTLTGSTQTLSGNLTLSGGTANGVLFLNGSKVATSGTALTFDSTQMDIGVGAYYGRLNLARTSATPYTTLTLTDPSVIANEVGIYLRSNGTNPVGISSAGAPVAFYLGGPGVTEGMRLDSSGNLGIGTASPSFRLTASYTAPATFTNASSDFLQMWQASGTNAIGLALNTTGTVARFVTNNGYVFAWNNASSEFMRLDGSGNLGIGTASPATKLNVVGTVTVDGVVDVNGGQIDLDTGQPIRWGGAASSIYAGSGTSDMVFTVGSSERFRVNGSSGNFGIGTASPARKLDVNGTVRIADGQSVEWGGTTLSIAGSSNTFQFFTSSTERMRLDSSGNLGLGVTPSAWGGGFAVAQYKGGFIGSQSNAYLYTGQNAYFDGVNYKYIATAAATLYEQVAGQHIWSTAPSGTAGNNISFTQALTLNSNGNLALQGGTTTASGVGITFPASQSASTDANCLDDYEEGTFTPGITFGGNAVSLTYASRNGYYTKIGNIVYYSIAISLSNKGTSTGSVAITGLPFTSSSASSLFPDSTPRAVNAFTFTAPLYSIVNNNATTCGLLDNNAGTQRGLTDTAFANNTEIAITGFYYT